MRHTSKLLLVLLATACATTKKPADVVWPDPPETARIKYVQSFASSPDIDNSGWSRFKREVVGGKDVKIQQPMGLALSEDGQRLYIADFQGSQLLRVDFQAKKLERLAEKEGIAFPFNVALDAAENVYVTEQVLRAVRVFDRAGNKLRSFGQGELERPTGIAIDKARNLVYVADTGGARSEKHRVLAFSTDGKLLRELGNGRGVEDGQFNFPTYLAVDARGNLYVADTMNFRVQVFDPDGGFLQKYGQAGKTIGSFARIKGLALDGFDNVYVVDGEHSAVQLFNQKFEPLMWFGGPVNKLEYMQMPSCIAIDPKVNRIYVCDQNQPRINAYDLVNTTAADSFQPSGDTLPQAGDDKPKAQ